MSSTTIAVSPNSVDSRQQQKYIHPLLTAQWNRDRMQSLVKTNLFPVVMTERFHLFPSRTQKLSSPVLKVLGWTRPGRISRCRIP